MGKVVKMLLQGNWEYTDSISWLKNKTKDEARLYISFKPCIQTTEHLLCGLAVRLNDSVLGPGNAKISKVFQSASL